MASFSESLEQRMAQLEVGEEREAAAAWLREAMAAECKMEEGEERRALIAQLVSAADADDVCVRVCVVSLLAHAVHVLHPLLTRTQTHDIACAAARILADTDLCTTFSLTSSISSISFSLSKYQISFHSNLSLSLSLFLFR